MVLTTTGPNACSAPKFDACTLTSAVISGFTIETDDAMLPGSMIAGELTAAWHRFGPVIEKEAADLTLAGSAPLIRPTHEGEIARLRGAAALVFQRGARRATSAAVTGSVTKST